MTLASRAGKPHRRLNARRKKSSARRDLELLAVCPHNPHRLQLRVFTGVTREARPINRIKRARQEKRTETHLLQPDGANRVPSGPLSTEPRVPRRREFQTSVNGRHQRDQSYTNSAAAFSAALTVRNEQRPKARASCRNNLGSWLSSANSCDA